MAELRRRYKERTALLDEWRSQGGIDATIFASRAAAGAAGLRKPFLKSGCVSPF
jgi:hypothetical protein